MTHPLAYTVVWHVHPGLDLIQMSGVLSGLAALARRGIISLKLDCQSVTPESSAVMRLTVTSRTGTPTRDLALDFHDREDLVFPHTIEQVDTYFKRQCGPASRAAAGGHVDKLRPLGLTVAGFSLGTFRLAMAAVGTSLRTASGKSTGESLRIVRQAARDARLWLQLPPIEGVRHHPEDRKASGIVFQPRLWDPVGASSHVFEVANRERIALVAELQAAFPDSPAIGLTRTPVARQLAPGLLLPTKVRTGRYHRQLRASTIAVNCAGLAGSVGWKLGEYLAAGCAIVSQSITKDLQVPLIPGTHYLPYTSPVECVAQCRRLLGDPTLARSMGATNTRFYEEHVDPPVLARNLLRATWA